MIKKPPIDTFEKVAQITSSKFLTQFHDTILDKYYRPLDDKGRYLPFDEFFWRVESKVDHEKAWLLTKLARVERAQQLLTIGPDNEQSTYCLTPRIQNAMRLIDSHCTEATYRQYTDLLEKKDAERLLLMSNELHEPIYSAKLEGAAITLDKAKQLITKKAIPGSSYEKMIKGNVEMMSFVWKNRNEPLSADLIKRMHLISTRALDRQQYNPGEFRSTDEIFITDSQDEIVFSPPTAIGLEKRIQSIIDFANEKHSRSDNAQYLHPLVKACAIEFAFACEHPFLDGNGRVARGLFYFFLLQHNYEAFRFLSISESLFDAPLKYGRSFVYAQTDHFDMTYFIDYRCEVIEKAINNLHTQLQDYGNAKRSLITAIYHAGLDNDINKMQATIILASQKKLVNTLTAREVQHFFDCSYNTALSALRQLVKLELFTSRKEDKTTVFKPTQQAIIL